MKTFNVIFRKDNKTNDIVAFFPQTLNKIGELNCYEHNGQHGTASISYYWDTKKATKEEYQALYDEMEAIYNDTCNGYDEPIHLVIKQRLSYGGVKHYAKMQKCNVQFNNTEKYCRTDNGRSATLHKYNIS